jgi:hypothetical protein
VTVAASSRAAVASLVAATVPADYLAWLGCSLIDNTGDFSICDATSYAAHQFHSNFTASLVKGSSRVSLCQ